MSTNDLEKISNLIRKTFNESEYLFNGPVSEEVVNRAEKKLKIKFPRSYKDFLSVFGSGGIGGDYIYGLGGKDFDFSEEIPLVTAYHVVWANSYNRKEDDNPDYLISIMDIGDGDTYCLDTSQMDEHGECPVVVWPIGGYEQTPVLEVVAKDFGEFFLNMVKQQIEYKNQTQS